MSLIGKFFVVMQILLSVTFMGFAVAVFTYQTDFKQKAETEQQARNQCNDTIHDATPPRPRPWRVSATVAIATATKVTVATMERGDRRACQDHRPG